MFFFFNYQLIISNISDIKIFRYNLLLFDFLQDTRVFEQRRVKKLGLKDTVRRSKLFCFIRNHRLDFTRDTILYGEAKKFNTFLTSELVRIKLLDQ